MSLDIRLQGRLRAVRSSAGAAVGIQYVNSAGQTRLTGLIYSYTDTAELYSPQVIAAGPLGRIVAINGGIGTLSTFDITTDLTGLDVMFDSGIVDRFGPEFIDVSQADDMVTDVNYPLTVLLAPLVFTNGNVLPSGIQIVGTLNAKVRKIASAAAGQNQNTLPTLWPVPGRSA